MARPSKKPGTQRVSIGASVLPEISEELEAIAIHEDRTKSQVIELLLERALNAYRRDGKLKELIVEPARH